VLGPSWWGTDQTGSASLSEDSPNKPAWRAGPGPARHRFRIPELEVPHRWHRAFAGTGLGRTAPGPSSRVLAAPGGQGGPSSGTGQRQYRRKGNPRFEGIQRRPVLRGGEVELRTTGQQDCPSWHFDPRDLGYPRRLCVHEPYENLIANPHAAIRSWSLGGLPCPGHDLAWTRTRHPARPRQHANPASLAAARRVIAALSALPWCRTISTRRGPVAPDD
jgi:hypothetical protein